jgi:RimJ/RimL family protein N-acetyltransferase
VNVEPVSLEGKYVRLLPTELAHVDDFIRIGLGYDLFRWFPWAVETPEQMRASVTGAHALRGAGQVLPFTTIDQASGQVVGSTSYLAIDRANRRLEIGATWLAPAWQRTACNTEAKYLQLAHAFEVLGCVRVEFKTDALNEQSRRALARIGAIEEGTFRQHMICPGGRLRDSVYYSILDREWPDLKKRLASRLYG